MNAKNWFGRKQETSGRTDHLLKQEVLQSINHGCKFKEAPRASERVLNGTIQNQLKKDLNLPCRHTAKIPPLTNKMIKKRLNFANTSIRGLNKGNKVRN